MLGRLLLAASAALVPLTTAHADWFGSGENRFEIPMVTIGSPGKAADTTGAPNPAGRVDYTYRIGKYEVPEEAVRKANSASELAGDPLGLTLDERGPQKPATGLSWFGAARFVNWLNEDRGLSPAYKFDSSGEFRLWTPTDPGYNPANPFRNTLAEYVLPSTDEWYKAAFYDPSANAYWNFPTGSDTVPTSVAGGADPGTAVWSFRGGVAGSAADVQLAGGASPFGTVGQAGNVQEWEESATDLLNDLPGELRGVRGGDYAPGQYFFKLSAASRNQSLPGVMPTNAGVRIVYVPEPTSLLLLLTSIISQSTHRMWPRQS